MNLHPVVVLVSVTLGGSLFGIVGAFLAVPTAAMIAVLFRYLQDMTALRAGEKTADDIKFVTRAGSITGKFGEQKNQELIAAKLKSQEKQASPPPRESDTQPDVDHLLVVQGIKAKISDLTHLFHKP